MKLCYWALLLGLVVLTLSGFADASPSKSLHTNQVARKTKSKSKLNSRKPSQTHQEKRKKPHPSTKPKSKPGNQPKLAKPTKPTKPKHNLKHIAHNATTLVRTRPNSVQSSYSTVKPKTPSSMASTFNHNFNHGHHSHHNATRQHNDTTIAHTRANHVQSSYHSPSGSGVQPQRPVMLIPQAPPSDSRKKSGTESVVKTIAETVLKASVKAFNEHGKPKPNLVSGRNYASKIKPLQKKKVTGAPLTAPLQQQPGSGMVCTPTNATVDQPDISNSTKTIQAQQFICYTAQQPQQQPAQPVVPLAPMNPLPENKSPPSHKSSNFRTSGSKSRLYSTSMLFSALVTFLVAFCMH